MIKRCLNLILTTSVIILCFQSLNTSVQAQNNSTTETEVYLEFSYQGVINSIVISYYKDNEFYLPVTELFSLFQIDYKTDGFQITGRFGIKQIPYTIDVQNNSITIGDKTLQLSAEDYLVDELDTYLRIELFRNIFSLNFSVDFNNLALRLQTLQELPAVEERIRQQRRRLSKNDRFTELRYPLKYDRETPFLDAGFFDYTYRTKYNSSNQETSFNFRNNIGLQLLGGDLQGGIFSNISPSYNSFNTQNLRWNYIVPDRNWLTRIQVGQTSSRASLNRSYNGIRLTNEPVEPRRLFNEFEIQGNTIPEAEVELYINEGLVDFQESDPDGYYRFLLPVSYGITRLDLRIYGPTGQIIRRSNQLQIPFNFQPTGEFNYDFSLGQLNNPIFGTTEKNYTSQFFGSYGINEWLSASAGVEYYTNINNNIPFFSTSLSSRIFNYYIFTFDIVSQAFYKSQLNVIYPNSSSFRIQYTNYFNDNLIFNPGLTDKNIALNFTYPINIFNRNLNFRASSNSRIRDDVALTDLNITASTRLNPLNIRIGYKNNYFSRRDITGISTLFDSQSLGSLNSIITYSIPRYSFFPDFLEGALLSSGANYLITKKKLISTNLSLSGRLLKSGRYRINYGRNFLANFNSLSVSISVEFDNIRSNSTYSTFGGSGDFSIDQSLSGSVAYDSNFNNFLFTNRDQVGRSGAAVRLFTDNNNNGSYEEFVDNLVDDNAIRVERSGARATQKNGILYLTHLEPYYYINMETNKANLRNPMLVPGYDKFGVITDPNRFKQIDIPFYLSGVLEGQVVRLRNETFTGIGGLKLILTSTTSDFRKEIRTFSDGSFYDYELPPGNYELKVAQSQLDILGVTSSPQKINFEVEALSEGDFIEGIRFELYPTDFEIPGDDEPADTLSQAIISSYQNAPSFMSYEEWLAQNVPVSLNLLVKAQKAFYNKNFQQAIAFINQSLELFETAQGYALKGSLYYLNGNEERAMANWRMAMELDPDIYIPSMELLQQEVNTSSTDTSSIE